MFELGWFNHQLEKPFSTEACERKSKGLQSSPLLPDPGLPPEVRYLDPPKNM